MDYFQLLQALILGVVEGLTEFLPVSSTGHLILVGALLDFNDARGKLFEIVIQSGAILAVCWEYRARISAVVGGLLDDRKSQNFARNIAIAFTPLAALGLLFGKFIKANLFSPMVVATTFILGGFIILWAERRAKAAGAPAATGRTKTWSRSSAGLDSWHVAFGSHHHRRHAVWLVAQSCHRVLIFYSDPHAHNRQPLSTL